MLLPFGPADRLLPAVGLQVRHPADQHRKMTQIALRMIPDRVIDTRASASETVRETVRANVRRNTGMDGNPSASPLPRRPIGAGGTNTRRVRGHESHNSPSASGAAAGRKCRRTPLRIATAVGHEPLAPCPGAPPIAAIKSLTLARPVW